MRFLFFTFIVLVGCGGPEFNNDLFTATGTGGDGTGGSEADAAGTGGSTATGGATAVETGGSSATGGHPAETGGATATNTGGSPETGGVVGTGGMTSTGGATASTGGAPATGGTTACTLVTHSNGLGQTWQDCAPLGTYDNPQAFKACNAWCAVNTCIGGCFSSSLCGSNSIAIAQTATIMHSWGFGASDAGDVMSTTNQGATCSLAGTWN